MNKTKTNTKTNKSPLALLGAIAAALSMHVAFAADTDGKLTRDEAKDLKTQSAADYKSSKKVTQAIEEQNKADCKTALEGGAKRSCVKSAKAAAKSDEYAAKAAHQVEEKAIDDARK